MRLGVSSGVLLIAGVVLLSFLSACSTTTGGESRDVGSEADQSSHWDGTGSQDGIEEPGEDARLEFIADSPSDLGVGGDSSHEEAVTPDGGVDTTLEELWVPDWTDEGPAPDNAIAFDLWRGGADGAVSLTIDEGVAEPYTILMPLIEEYGWRATYFVYTEQPYWPEVGCPPFDGPVPIGPETWPLIKDAHLRGHEVTNHTHTHPNMSTKTPEQNHKELQDAMAELRTHVSNELTFFSFSYPYEMSDDAVWSVVKQYHRYARGGDHGVPVPPHPIPLNPAVDPDWGFLQAKAPTADIPVASWNSWVDAAVNQKKWFIEELHGVRDGDVCGGWEARTVQEFREHFDHMTSYGDRLYVAPMGEVARYIEQRSSASWDITLWSSQGIVLVISDGFQDQRGDYFVPISWVLEVPEEWGWTGVSATRGNQQLLSSTLSGTTFRVEAVPDSSRPVIITPTSL